MEAEEEMTELKTLKDFGSEVKVIAEACGKARRNINKFSIRVYLGNNLREEAIKDIKCLTKALTTGGKGMPDFMIPYDHIVDWRSHMMTTITYIKWKFNIIEEDLK